ncbi:MAG: SDR family NAD(P)-dependent oxidoreductase [Alphaproteobacteria bacterium]|jgi:NAD(P)-dependent dehydrogenase (short-subunit alcohol dehydrogenase family)
MHTNLLSNFNNDLNIAVIGSSGGIGNALVSAMESTVNVKNIIHIARSNSKTSTKQNCLHIDLLDEETIINCSNKISEIYKDLDIIINASGFLHDNDHKPEKSYKMIDAAYLEKSFRVNTFGPFLLAKHFIPLLRKDRKSIFSCISARVGSIEDNQLGGWHSYRASKAALNMLLKNLSIELKYTNKHAICVGLHPGTVDTNLSKPFPKSRSHYNVFTPNESSQHLISVINKLEPKDSGNTYDWAGKRIPF